MRFSSIFQRPAPSLPERQQRPAGEQVAPIASLADAAATPDPDSPRSTGPVDHPLPVGDTRGAVPDELELDARVRLLGEWQLGEA